MTTFFQKLGQVIAVLGGQWGDEGKGKLVDILSAQYDIVARANGGANAGHTVYLRTKEGEKKFIFHLLPSGILHQGKICVLGNGMAVHLPALLEEIAAVEKKGIGTKGRILISNRAHLLFDYHKIIDGLQEESRGETSKIQTTLRGIGPCYVDKTARRGIRFNDLLDFETLKEKLKRNLEFHQRVYGFSYDLEKDLKYYRKILPQIKPCLIDTAYFLNQAFKKGQKILLEGANGIMLGIDHGTYPYVTSSDPGVTGVLAGSGLPPSSLKTTIGIIKAYVTRVGGGPFPTELKDALGAQIREAGGEYGATTGRPRRCGWEDAVLARYSVMINGYSTINLTKLDVLSHLEKIKIGIKYLYQGKELKSFPASLKILEKIKVNYLEMKGWKRDISKARKFKDLPPNAQKYILKIEELVGVPIKFIGVGRRRDQIIFR